MRCNCGGENDSSAHFCGSCGARLSQVEKTEDNSQNSSPWSTPSPESGRGGFLKGALIAGGAMVGVLAIVGALAFQAAPTTESNSDPSPTPVATVTANSNSALDDLRANCASGDYQACDELYIQSPAGSDDEKFGETCGNRNTPAGSCVEIYSNEAALEKSTENTASKSPATSTGGTSTSVRAGNYGSNATLDRLWDRCANGDYPACDRLYLDSPFGSEYEKFGDSCGNRNIPAGYCVDIYGSGGGSTSSNAGNYGSNATLDRLWDRCANGDYAACDQLYLDSPAGSEYERFGDTCGNRNTAAGYCEDIYGSNGGSSSSTGSYGSNANLDRLWDRCANGDYVACDELYLDSPAGSEYERFGDSCGNRNTPAGYCEDIYG
jgi:hypothetical protein